MDGLISSLNSSNSTLSLSSTVTPGNAKEAGDFAIIKSINNSKTATDKVSVSFSDLYKGLAVEAREIIDAINKHLENYLPEGVQSLTPEEATSEATADRIVAGVTGLFAAYQKSNSDMDAEELLNSFMNAVRKGVDQGYDEAFKILEGLGAFNYDGVQSGIEKTLSLVHEKLDAFEENMKHQLGIVTDKSDVEESVTSLTHAETLSQGGVSILKNIAA